MKTGNVILALLIWFVILPIFSFLIGFVFAVGGETGLASVFCTTTAIILFIVGLVVLILGAENNQAPPNIHNIRHCPNCGRSIPFDANACPYCSKNFNEPAKVQRSLSEKKYCSECGSEVNKKAKFCDECGNKL